MLFLSEKIPNSAERSKIVRREAGNSLYASIVEEVFAGRWAFLYNGTGKVIVRPYRRRKL
ncbi:hypothetical protein B9G55_00305 [Saccharibacillus sp. O16]|nr:hypothetical protein B9G55_00305 [Saccharibacillus sp. O16]